MLGRALGVTKASTMVAPVITVAVRNYPGKNKIKVELSERFTGNPQPTKYFEDPQAVEPFEEENRGLNVYLRTRNTLYKQLAAVEPPSYITKVPFTEQDTLYTYTKRIHKIQMKTLAHWFRKMEIVRMARLNELAVKEADVMFQRKAEYAAWKARKKANNQYQCTLYQQKRAAELRTLYKLGKKSRERSAQNLDEKHAKQIEMLLEEKRNHWITDPENVNPQIFESVSTAPTGWWPTERTKARFFRDDFLTDDEDRDTYFNTKRINFTRKRPEYDEFGQFYVDSKNVKPPTQYSF